MLRKFYLLILVLNINSAFAIEATTASKINDGIAIEKIQAYAASSTKSKKVGIVEPGTELIEFRTFMKTKPGLATMEETPKDFSIPFDRGAPIQIWEYIGRGFSKVIINNIRYNTKIARSKTECRALISKPKYCWAKVIEEPEYYEWKQVALKQDGQKFWILNRIVDGSGVLVISDKGIEQTRIIHTKYVEEPKKEETPEIIVEVKNKLLLDPELKTDKTQEDSLENNVAKNLLLSPEERKKARAEAKAKLKEAISGKKVKETPKTEPELTKEEIFKQQKIDTMAAPVNKQATQATISTINKDTQAPATKLKLEANKPLTLQNNY